MALAETFIAPVSKWTAENRQGSHPSVKSRKSTIYTREYQANNGIIEFDIRSVNQEEMNKIVQRLQEIMDTKEK